MEKREGIYIVAALLHPLYTKPCIPYGSFFIAIEDTEFININGEVFWRNSHPYVVFPNYLPSEYRVYFTRTETGMLTLIPPLTVYYTHDSSSEVLYIQWCVRQGYL